MKNISSVKPKRRFLHDYFLTRRKPYRFCLYALATVAALALSKAAVSEEFEFTYPISGLTVQELMARIKLRSESPVGAFGYTELNTHVGWTALVDNTGKCTIETVNFTYDITIYMPDWINKHEAKVCLQNNWDKVWTEIQIHEETHRNLYRLIDVNNINKRILAIKPRSSCAALENAINFEVEMVLNENNRLHDDFHAANKPATLWSC